MVGGVRLFSGHADRAIEALETAGRLNPGLSIADPRRALLGFGYYLQGRYDDAVRELEGAKGPDAHGNIHIGLAAAYAKVGRDADAAREATQVYRLAPFFDVAAFVAQFRNPTDAGNFADGLIKAGLN
jgi:tetratricopeptide (TPR) repeat protein